MGLTKLQKQAKSLRECHINLGSGENPDQYISTAAASYVQQKQRSNEQLAKEAAEREQIKKSLRSTHYTLGMDGGHYQTTNRNDLCPQPLSRETVDFAAKKAALRKSNIHFGAGAEADPDHYISTNQKEMFIPMSKHTITADNITKACRAAKTNNVVFGTDDFVMKSTFNQDYDEKPIEVEFVDGKAISAGLRESHIELGNEKLTYKSTSAEAYTKEIHDKNKTEKAAAPSTRGTNFKFGYTPEPVGQSESSYQYGQLEAVLEHCRNKSFAEAKDLRSHSYVLGSDDNADLRNQSVSQATYIAKKMQSPAEAQAIKDKIAAITKELRTTNIVLGDGKRFEKMSLSNVEYAPPPSSAYKTEGVDFEKIKRGLRATHWVNGTDTEELQECRKQGLTHESHRDLFKELQPAALSKEQRDDLRAHHFRFGTDPTPKKTTASDSYVHHHGAGPAVLQDHIAHDLKASHFCIGDDDVFSKDLKSSSQATFIHHGNYEQSSECAAVKARIRKSNISFGSDRMRGVSEAQDSFIWRVREEDTPPSPCDSACNTCNELTPPAPQ